MRELLNGSRSELKLDVVSPGTTPVKLRDVDYGMQCDIAGIVRSMDDITYFDRDGGGEGQVRGIRIQDSTADIRCALWGDHAEAPLSVGDPVLCRNVEIQDGFQDDIEASVGWGSDVELLDPVDIEFVTVQLRDAETTTPAEMADDEPSDAALAAAEPDAVGDVADVPPVSEEESDE